jgi:hypothetical protein
LVCLSFISVPNQTYAAFRPCRGDPIIDTPNYTIQSIVEVYTDIKNIDRVEYVYHVPAGKILPVMFDASPLAAKEKVSFTKGGWGDMRVDTIVYLKNGVAPVQVSVITTVTDKRDGTSTTTTITGMSGQQLVYTNQS